MMSGIAILVRLSKTCFQIPISKMSSTIPLCRSMTQKVIIVSMIFAWLFSYSQEYDLCPIPCSLAHLRCPIANKQYSSNPKFRHFHRQLYHSSLAHILQSLKPGMTKPTVVCCPDRHFQLVIYGLGPLIADYPEQALIACIVQGWCPK